MAQRGRTQQRRQPRRDPLLEKAEELERIRHYVDETSFAGDEREANDELSTVDQHPADTADHLFQREMDQTVRRIVDIEADQVRHAIERRNAGMYGICENCERTIPPERMKARPEATLCVDCQRERERHF